MKRRFEKRILSLVLCLSMVFTLIITHANFAFSADDELETPQINTENFENNVGKQAIFDWWPSFDLAPDIDANPDEYNTYDYDELEIAERVFVIADYYSDNDGNHWYKLYASDGMEAPEILKENPWVFFAADSDKENGIDPALCIYEADETIRFVRSLTDPESNYYNYYVIAGPQEIANAEITFTLREDRDFPISNLAYTEGTYNSVLHKAFDITIDKAVGEEVDLWTAEDGVLSIRYETPQHTSDTYDDVCDFGASYMYVDGELFNATIADRFYFYKWTVSSITYTNSGNSLLVFEIMPPSCTYVGEEAYFANDSVELYDNNMQAAEFLAAQLPVTFTAECSFEDENGEKYYWLEDKGFIGSPYFIVKEEDVVLDALPEEYGDGRVSITDKMGNSVSEIVLPQYEKPEFTAISSLSKTTADVKYQWQICYDVDNYLWVDIYGENDETIKLSYGMVKSILDENGQCAIRCESKTSTMTAYSKPIVITLEMYEPKEPDVVVSESFVTSNGETVTVSVAGDIPEDASVALEETDSSGVDVNPGETVVASLDISIKNADGSQWQPESGETVKVELPAEAIGLKNGDRFVVYHLHQGVVEILGTYMVTNGTVTFDVDGFSKFVFALTEQSIATDDLQHQVTHKATINSMYNDLWLVNDPTVITGYQNIYTTAYEGVDYVDGIEFVISGVYVSEINPYGVFYKVEAVDSNNLLSAVLLDFPWVFQRYLDESDDYGTLVIHEEVVPPTEPEEPEEPEEPFVHIYDENGEIASFIEMSASAKHSITAKTSLTGSVKYQWQVCYDVDNYLWMDIYGQTSETLTLSYALLAGVLDEEGMGAVRCVTSNAVETIESFPIVVSVLESDVEEAYSLYNTDGRMMYASTPDSADGGISTFAETPNTVLVTVQFVIGNSTTPIENGLFTYYVPYNGNAKDNIVIPEVQGYAAYLEDDRTTPVTGIYALDETNVTEPKTITFRFWPAEVTYKVVYMLQNATDDEYTAIITENLTGFTGSDPVINREPFKNNPEIDTNGIVHVWESTDKIASDGKTVIEVKYDRLYFKMLFDLDGGYGVQPIYARYGTPVSVINPTKEGYSFMGWNALNGPYNKSEDAEIADIVNFTDIEIPAEHTNYKALWKASSNAKVTVIVWGQKANNSDDLTDHNSYDYMSETTEGVDLTNLQFKAKPGASVTYNPNGGYVCGYTEQHTHGQGNCEATCNKTEHTHSAVNGSCYTLSCKDTVHTAHTESCYTCGVTTHNHTVDCYNKNDIGNSVNPTTRIPSNPAEGYVYDHWYYNELIFINGSWYRYSGSTAAGSIANTTCGKTESTHNHTDDCIKADSPCPGIHAHGNGCYTLTCTTETHTHNAACYSGCAKEEHTHSSDCRPSIPMESNLWEFDHADTVTVSADGTTTLNVYYRRKTFTITFHYNRSNNGSYRQTSTITDVWGADIGTRFLGVNTTANGNLWSEESSGGSPWTSYLQIMPKRNVDYYCRYTSSNKQSAEYYTQNLDGTYKLEYTVTAYYGDTLSISKEDFYEMEGFAYSHGTDGEGDSMPSAGSYGNFHKAKFYYNRNDYNLVFQNYGEKEDSESVLFEAPLASYGSFELDDSKAPAYYQPGSVTFAGWYAAPQTPGDFNFENVQPFDFANSTMPASDLIVYAWWKPVTHTVTYYYDINALANNEIYIVDDKQQVLNVPHGSKIQDPYIPPKDPMSNYYSFEGWVYKDANGTEIMWDYENSTVTGDVNLYGKWKSTTAADYVVKFVTIKDGVEVEIADSITGAALGGTSKTFDAKFNEDLYEGYQDRYYPRDMSHTITIDIANPDNNTFIFYYDYVDFTSYTVKYLEAGTNKPMSEINSSYPSQKTVDKNTHAMVTETFVAIPGYLPDAYQKVCKIVPEGKNEIIFYYTKDDVNGLYTVHFWLQDLDGNYVEDVSLQVTATSANGSTITAPTNTVIPNYTFKEANPDTVTINKEVISHIHMYYDRTVHDYRVQYLEAGTNKVLATEKVVEDLMWGTLITENAIDIKNYDVYGDSSKSIEILVDETKNVIKFYYIEERVKVNYAVVGPDGTVDRDGDADFGKVTPNFENLAIITGTASGSVAASTSNLYKFVGWYSDAACTKEVGTNATFVPTKEDDALWEDGTTYYAKFEYNLTSLTIDKIFPDGADYSMDENQSFLFDVVEVDADGKAVDGGVQLRVTVHGDGQITIDGLTVGHYYKIIEKTDWSWRYDKCTPSSAIFTEASADGWIIVKLTANASSNIVTFKNERSEDKWLDGDSWCNNIFNTPVNQTK